MSPPIPAITGLEIRPLPQGRLQILFPYHSDNVDRIKTIAGRQWHREEKFWSVPHTEKVIAALQRLFGQVPPRSFSRPDNLSFSTANDLPQVYRLRDTTNFFYHDQDIPNFFLHER